MKQNKDIIDEKKGIDKGFIIGFIVSFIICAFFHAAEVYLSHRTTVLSEIGP